MKKTFGAICAVAVLSLSACGGGGADRPTADELSKVLQSSDNALGTAVPKEAADCVSKAFVDSDLSDEALNAIVEGDEDFDGSKEDEEAIKGIVSSDLTKCITDATTGS